jgi:hypothetical protein
VFVSIDSVLSAVHRSYDKILRDLEGRSLQPALLALLASVRDRLGAAALEPDVAHDLGLYFAVAHGLLDPSAPGLDAEAQELVAAARAASGIATINLFGTPRDEDFSQFVPRGHYTDGLEDYFRAMMWLGRVDFRFLETQKDGSRVFRRRQFAAAAAIPSLLDEAARERWNALDRTVTAFVGEADYLSLPRLEALLADLGIAGPADVAGKTDAEFQAAIEAGGYGAQRIASRLIVVGPATETLPLDASFAFLGQRYSVDSHVFSNVVYDRVEARRMMPNPLDVAFAALGNDQAGALLAPELESYGYAAELAGTRTLVDAHERGYWESSLYTLWLGALRQLSPRRAEPPGLPPSPPPRPGGAGCSAPSSAPGRSSGTTRSFTPSSRTPGSRSASTPMPTSIRTRRRSPPSPPSGSAAPSSSVSSRRRASRSRPASRTTSRTWSR